MGSFAVGTWVAGSAVWLWYLGLLPAALRAAADASSGYGATGVILLPAVATQSLAVARDALLPGGMPRVVATALILLGCLFYAGGFVLVVRCYGRRDWTLADDRDDGPAKRTV